MTIILILLKFRFLKIH